MIAFDHIEVHVRDIPAYCDFLVRLFAGGRFKQLNDEGVAMFKTPDGFCFELKPRTSDAPAARSGFCLPCIRAAGARAHIASLGFAIDHAGQNPDGEVLFFTDHEGIEWHMKDHDQPDAMIDW